MILGVGWQDCQSSPTCTLHPLLTSLWQEKISRSLQFWDLTILLFIPHADILLGSTSLLNTHALQFRVLPVVVHLHALPIVCSLFSRTEIFLVSPTQVFLCGFVDGVGGSFSHGLIGGSTLLLLTQQDGSYCSRSPTISCRRPFHAQELCAVCVILIHFLSYSGMDYRFPHVVNRVCFYALRLLQTV